MYGELHSAVRCCRLPHTSKYTHSAIGPCVHSHAQIGALLQLHGRSRCLKQVMQCNVMFVLLSASAVAQPQCDQYMQLNYNVLNARTHTSQLAHGALAFALPKCMFSAACLHMTLLRR